METPISATQKRVALLLSIETDGTYAHAAHQLQSAGFPLDGCPAGHDWRSVKKLSDDALRALLTPDHEANAPYGVGTYESAADRNLRLAAETRQARKDRGARTLAWQRGEIEGEDEEDQDIRERHAAQAGVPHGLEG